MVELYTLDIMRMGSTYLQLNYHIIFSTKDREKALDDRVREDVHGYLGGTIKGLGGRPLAIGGTDDHVHLLISLRSHHQLSELLRQLKWSSSKWVREEIQRPHFSWQRGYGAFTVSPSAYGGVRKYIANQKEHHRKMTFREEFERLLKLAGVAYEPQYLD